LRTLLIAGLLTLILSAFWLWSPKRSSMHSALTKPPSVKTSQVDSEGSLATASLNSRVGIRAFGCGMVPRLGAGVTIAGRLVLTDAHVVAGSTSLELRIDGRTASGTVVHLDPRLDLALIQLTADFAWPENRNLTFGSATKGDSGWVTLLRDDTLKPTRVRVIRPVTIITEDIYVNGRVTRRGYEIEAATRPGDSGAAVTVGGKVIGLLWSRSRLSDNRAWVTDTSTLALLSKNPKGWVVPADTRCR
jgi:Trypsin-like peptidase domain